MDVAKDLYSISFQESGMLLGMKMAPSSTTTAADPEAVEGQGKDAANSAKDYLEQHGLLKYVQSLLHAVIQAKPVDPYAYMMEQLSAAQSKRNALAEMVSRPGSAVGARRVAPNAIPPTEAFVRPVPPSAPPPSSSPPGRPRPPERDLVHVDPVPRLPLAAQYTQATVKVKEDLEPTPVNDQINNPLPLQPLPRVDAATPSVDLAEHDVPDELEKVRLQLKGRLEEAFRSGSLDDAVRKAIDGEVAPEAEPEAAEAPMDDIVKLQIQLRAVMLDAVETPSLQEALAAVRPQPEEEIPALSFAEPDPLLAQQLSEQDDLFAMKQDIKTSFEGCLARGELEKVLPSAQGAMAPIEVEEIKGKMRLLLQESVSTGNLEQTLGKIKAKPEVSRAATADKADKAAAGDPSAPPDLKSSRAATVPTPNGRQEDARHARPVHVRDRSYERMILQTSGQWFLNGCAGSYEFDDSTGCLSSPSHGLAI
eukprot:symbB.v1.2.035821.t1/scaffold4914.1/size32966/3